MTPREKSMEKIDQRTQKLWHNIRKSNIYVIGIPDRGEREGERESEEIFEVIMDKNLSKQ